METLVNAYPTASITQYITREPFRYILVPAVAIDDLFTLTVSTENRFFLQPSELARARVDLPNPAAPDGLVVGVYNTLHLFYSRPQYLEYSNRTNFVVGGKVDVISVSFKGQLERSSLSEPVRITFWKTEEASENGTATECVFWDQSLDEGYGAWSGEGCRLVSETTVVAVCSCNHLTQFTILVVSVCVCVCECECELIL